MTTSMIANASDWNAVVFAMKCVLNERSLFSPVAGMSMAAPIAGSISAAKPRTLRIRKFNKERGD